MNQILRCRTVIAAIILALASGCEKPKPVPKPKAKAALRPITFRELNQIHHEFLTSGMETFGFGEDFELSGVVVKVGTDPWGIAYVWLGEHQERAGSARFDIHPDMKTTGLSEEYQQLAKGKKATIRGTYRGNHPDSGPSMVNCKIVQVEEGPPPLRNELEGRWRVIQQTEDGNELKYDENDRGGPFRNSPIWSIADDELRIEDQWYIGNRGNHGGNHWKSITYTGSIQVDSTRTPKVLSFKARGAKHDDVDSLSCDEFTDATGTYELTGERLVLSIHRKCEVVRLNPRDKVSESSSEMVISLERDTMKSPPPPHD